MTNKLAFLILTLLSTISAFAGTPEQDKYVRVLRSAFTNSLGTFPTDGDGWSFAHAWSCVTHNAFKDDFYSEPDMTFRLTMKNGLAEVINDGNAIFKNIEMTNLGLQSDVQNEALGNNDVFMTMRPHFTYQCGKESRCDQKRNVKSVSLIGEVSVEPRILPHLANYYGYTHKLTGVSSVVDPSKTVFYYFSCKATSEREASQSETRSRLWSIPAELSRHWH